SPGMRFSPPEARPFSPSVKPFGVDRRLICEGVSVETRDDGIINGMKGCFMLKWMKRWIQGVAISLLAFLAFSVPAFASNPPTPAPPTPDLLVRQIMGLAYESQQSIN